MRRRRSEPRPPLALRRDDRTAPLRPRLDFTTTVARRWTDPTNICRRCSPAFAASIQSHSGKGSGVVGHDIKAMINTRLPRGLRDRAISRLAWLRCRIAASTVIVRAGSKFSACSSPCAAGRDSARSRWIGSVRPDLPGLRAGDSHPLWRASRRRSPLLPYLRAQLSTPNGFPTSMSRASSGTPPSVGVRSRHLERHQRLFRGTRCALALPLLGHPRCAISEKAVWPRFGRDDPANINASGSDRDQPH